LGKFLGMTNSSGAAGARRKGVVNGGGFSKKAKGEFLGMASGGCSGKERQLGVSSPLAVAASCSCVWERWEHNQLLGTGRAVG
jgi:hypothetical protein